MSWSRLVLILLLLFDVWYRGHTFGPSVRINLWPTRATVSEPLDCDEAAYAYIGHRIKSGDVLYRDLTENKPPLGYWLYTAAVALGGYNELAIRVLPIPFVLTTIALVWWIGLRLGGPGAACLAAGLFVVLSTDPYLFGNGANLEHFINCFAISSLALLIRGWDRADRWSLVGSGVCLGAATLVKQVAIAPVFVFVPGLAWRAWTQVVGWRRRTVRALLDVTSWGLGVVSIVAVAAAILIARGAARSAFEDIFRYGSALATDTLPDPNAPPVLIRWITGNADPAGHLPWPFGTTDYLVWWGSGSWPLWLVSIPALAYLLLSPRSTPERRLVAGWALAAWAQVALPGLYWQHYYLLPVAGVAITIAVCWADAAAGLGRALGFENTARARETSTSRLWPARSGARRTRLVVSAFLAIVLTSAIGATLLLQFRYYLLLPPQELTIRYKGGRQWVVLRQMGREMARRAAIWDHPHLYVWGWQSPLHFYARLDSPTRHFFVDNLLRDQADRGHPLIEPRTQEIMSALERRPPELIFTGYPPFRALKAFLSERYLPSRIAPGLWIKRDDFGRFETALWKTSPRLPAGSPSIALAGSLVEHALISISESGHDCIPALGKSVFPGGARHLASLIRVFDQPEQGRGQAHRWLRRFDEYPGCFRLDGLADPAGPKGHHGQTRRHRLEHDIAKRLGQARKREDVGCSVVVREVFSLAIAREPGKRTDPVLQRGSRRPISNQEDAHLGPTRGDDRQCGRQIVDILLRGDPTYVGNHHILGRPPERPAHLQAARPPGPKERSVDPALPEHKPLEAQALEVADRCLRRDVGLASIIVKPAQISPDRGPRPTNAVMPAVLIEIGVETRHDGTAAAQRAPQDAPAERCLGGDVDDVWLKGVDGPVNASKRRPGKIKLLVERQDDGTHGMDLSVIHRLAVVWVNQLNPVAASRQDPDQLTQRSGNAVDLGKVGFRDQCDSHVSGRAPVVPVLRLVGQKMAVDGSRSQVFEKASPVVLPRGAIDS